MVLHYCGERAGVVSGMSIVLVLITSIFTFYQEAKSDAIMDSFKKMVPQNADAIRDGDIHSVESRELVPGDIVMVEKGKSYEEFWK